MNKYWPFFFFLVALFFTVNLSFYYFYRFQTFYYDFGIFARIIWLISQFQPPIIEHIELGQIHFLGDHFNPSLYFLAPLFWLWADPRILLIEQAFFTIASMIMIYLIGLKYKLQQWVALFVALLFLIFPGTLFPLVSDWHPETTAGFFLLLFFYLFTFTKQKILSLISVAIFLGFKESNGLSLAFLLLWMFVVNKEQRKNILILLIISITWFLLTVNIFIPTISAKAYLYSPVLPSSLKDLFQGPSIHLKLHLIYQSLLSYGFLPLLNLLGLLPALGELGIRLLPVSSKFQNFNLGLHYSVYLGIYLALASIQSLALFRKRRILFGIILFTLLLSLFSARKITSSPINLAINPQFWSNINPQLEVGKVIENIPENGSLMSQNNILPHLTLRKDEIYLLSREYGDMQPDFIVIDISSGQNPNNYWGPDGPISYNELYDLNRRVSADKNYILEKYSTQNIRIYKKVIN